MSGRAGTWIAALVAGSVLLGSCGGGDSDDDPAPEAGGAKEPELRVYDWEANVVGLDGVKDPGARPFGSPEAALKATAGVPDVIVIFSEDPAGFFAVRDRPALTEEDIENPRQEFDPAGDEPVVAFDFTSDGEDAFEELTRRIAQRGLAEAPQGVDSITADHTSGHFAIVLDGELVALPIVNFVENPEGISAENGAVIGGTFTIDEAKELASSLGGERGG